jgi:predicted dehydrogenase
VNAALIGCGLIGQKRAKALAGAKLVVCSDVDLARAEKLASGVTGCRCTSDWRKAITNSEISLVVVATSHDALAEIARGAIEAGKHVLIEKPGARWAAELLPLVDLARRKKVLVRIGFNHRYHRALRHARKIVDSGHLGPLMFIRARYGHGGRPGYDKEWRANPALSGGGELVDQGIHLIDLARWFLGDFSDVVGFAHTYFWEMPVDDNCFMLLKTARKQVAFLHASWTEWKNTFSFEIYGREGKLLVDGLGGSYGVERLAWYKMSREMGPPETTIWEYPMADDSWDVEMSEFLEDIRLEREPAAGLTEAIAALEIVDKVYKSSGYDHRA